MNSPALSPRRLSHWGAAIVATGFVGLLQIPMAVIGTELGWAGGVDVGVQTLKTGRIFGLVIASLLLILVVTLGHWSFRKYPRRSWVTLGAASLVISLSTVGFTMLRASASFFHYLDP